MSIYVFSLLIGYELSGVDVAQGRRSSYLCKRGIPVKHVFTSIPELKHIEHYINCGIQPEQMISLQLKMFGLDNLAGDFLVEKKIEQLKNNINIDNIVESEENVTLYINGNRFAVMEKKNDGRYFHTISFFEEERLIAREIYTDRLIYTHHYITVADDTGMLFAKLNRTVFVDNKGKKVCECFYEDGNEIYMYPNGMSFNRYELLEKSIKELYLTEKDTVIIDRPSYMEYIQPLLKYKNNARLSVFLHSLHYYEPGEGYEGLYLSYEYYGWFKFSKYIDDIIVSTQAQKEELISKYIEYNCYVPRIEVIPASGLEKLRYPVEERIPYSLITTSRINKRKNIEWMILSVVKAHEMIPQLTLDIYGTGADECVNSLKLLVKENNAEDYICFKGKADVSELYKKYEVYITTSLWETLGLSNMEAAGSGNAMIGLDVRYGNPLFIKNDINGKLIDFDLKEIEKEGTKDVTIEKLAKAIVEVFDDKECLEKYHENSYNIAKDFLDKEIEQKWVKFLNKS